MNFTFQYHFNGMDYRAWLDIIAVVCAFASGYLFGFGEGITRIREAVEAHAERKAHQKMLQLVREINEQNGVE